MHLRSHSADRLTEAAVSSEIWKCGEGVPGGPGDQPASLPDGGGGVGWVEETGRCSHSGAGLSALREQEPKASEAWGCPTGAVALWVSTALRLLGDGGGLVCECIFRGVKWVSS